MAVLPYLSILGYKTGQAELTSAPVKREMAGRKHSSRLCLTILPLILLLSLIPNGHHAYHRRVLLHVAEHLLKRRAADQLYLLTLEIQVCRNVVERPYQSLYRYSFHIFVVVVVSVVVLIKKLRFHWLVKRSLITMSVHVLILHTTYRFTIACKVKVIAVKVSIQHVHCLCVLFIACKSITFSRIYQTF